MGLCLSHACTYLELSCQAGMIALSTKSATHVRNGSLPVFGSTCALG
jgi:hypothetical protein